MAKGKNRTAYSAGGRGYDRFSYDNAEPIPSDVLGSYTGLTQDGSPPVQDADDL